MSEEIQRYEQMLAEDPKSRAFAPLAEAYRKAGRLDDAIRTVETGLKIHPDYTGGLVVLGRVLYEKNELERSSEILQRAVKDAPDNYLAQKFYAKVLVDRGETEKAIVALEASYMLSPDDQEITELLEEARKKVVKPSTMDFADSEEAPEIEVPAPPPPRPLTVDGVELEPLGGEFREIGDGTDQALLGAEPVSMGDIKIESLTGFSGTEDTGGLEDEELPEGMVSLIQEVEEIKEPVLSADLVPEPVFVQEIELSVPVEEVLASPRQQPVPDPVTEEPLEIVPEPVVPEPIVPVIEPVIPETPPDTAVKQEDEEIATETLADLYAGQGLTEKALEIYNQLLVTRPDDPVIIRKIRDLDTVNSQEPTVQDDQAEMSEEQAPAPVAAETVSPEKDEIEILEGWLENIERMK
jgi:tetratricopeptide (TPR) repeat protein